MPDFRSIAPKETGKPARLSSGMNFEVPHAKAVAEWGPRGFLAVLAAMLNRNGRIEGTFTSSEPPRPALPRQGKIDLLWTAFNLALLQPFLPEGFLLEGEAEGKMKGEFAARFSPRPGGRMESLPGKFELEGRQGDDQCGDQPG